jgi:glycine/D-amino acid oxidase-like deaminating enzyme
MGFSATPAEVVVIGGGFYGCSIALHRHRQGRRVTVLDESPTLLTRASYNNQARVHQGYHYPRNLRTGLSSSANFPRFVRDYREAVLDGFEKLYAIARRNSQVTASQFASFCRTIGAPHREASPSARALFDPDLIEEVFEVREVAFDAVALRRMMARQLEEAAIEVRMNTPVARVEPLSEGRIAVHAGGDTLIAEEVFVCLYSRINHLLRASGLPVVPMKHEIAEIALVHPSPAIAGRGITVMDGPFFSTMPFPAERLHSFTHVRYTPHEAWHDDRDTRDPYTYLDTHTPETKFPLMIRDALRYLPALKGTTHVRSLFDTKTVLIENEDNDGRPILYRRDYQSQGLTLILGGKIDNIYDILYAIDEGTPPPIAALDTPARNAPDGALA